MTAIEFLFSDTGEPQRYLVKCDTFEQEQRLMPIARVMLQAIESNQTTIEKEG